MLTYAGVPRRTAVGLRLLVGFGWLGILVAVGTKLSTTPGVHGYLGGFFWIGLGVLPGLAVATWLVRRRPDHPQTRRLLLATSAAAAGVGIQSVIQAAYRTPGDGTWLWAASLLEQTVGMVSVVASSVVFGSYPDGTVERPWQRWVLRALWAQVVLPPMLLLSSPTLVIHPLVLSPVPQVSSPLALGWLAPLAPALTQLYLGYYGALVGVAVLALRFLQAGAEQRRRMRFLVYGMALGVVVLLSDNTLRIVGVPPDSGWFLLFGTLYIPLALQMPVAIVLGVVRYRLFDVDLVLRRSVVFGALSLGIAAAYIALAAAPGLTLGRQIPVELAVVLTIAAALVFQPLRRRLETLADRCVFGRRVNRYQLLTTFGANLEKTVDLRELLPTLADTVRRGLGASWVRVTVPHAGAVVGDPVGEAALSVPLDRGDMIVGHIECGPNHAGFEPGDRELLATLARQAATAIANVQLTAQLADRLDELARSRTRIVAAQDTERRRIERDLHDGAQQHVVALITKLRLARNQLGRGERSTDAVLDEVAADAQDLLTDLRDLAHGIHPPVLSDRGLVAAVTARTDRIPLDIAIHADPALRELRFAPDIEDAAYFTVCETLTNIVKHADTQEAHVALATVNGCLEIIVSDAGLGYSATNGTGHGLTNLRDRVEALGGTFHIDGRPGAGTTVRAAIPVGTPDG